MAAFVVKCRFYGAKWIVRQSRFRVSYVARKGNRVDLHLADKKALADKMRRQFEAAAVST